MARYKISKGALRSSFMGGLSSGVVQAKYARQQNELEEKKLENQAKQLDLNTQILENQITDQAATRALTETTQELENNVPNTYNFFSAKKDNNNKFALTNKLFMLPKPGTNAQEAETASQHFNFVNNKIATGDENFLYALREQPEEALAMLSELYTKGSAGYQLEGVGDDKDLVKDRRLFIIPELMDYYEDMFSKVPGLKDYVLGHNAELGLVLPKDRKGKLTYQVGQTQHDNGQYHPHVDILGVPGTTSTTLSGQGIQDIQEITGATILNEGDLEYKTVSEAASMMEAMNKFANIPEEAKRGAAFLFKEKDFFKFTELAKTLHTKGYDDQQIKNMVASFLAADGQDIPNLDNRKAFSRSVVFATALARFGPDLFTHKKLSNGFYELSLNPTFHKKRITDFTKTEAELAAAEGFSSDATKLVETNRQIRELTEELGYENPNVFTLGQRVTGSVFDFVFSGATILKGVASIAGFDDEISNLLSSRNIGFGVIDSDTQRLLTGAAAAQQSGNSVLSTDGKLFENNIIEINKLYAENMADNIEAYKNNQFSSDANLNKEIFLKRAEAESLKVRMAFKAASLVQGGGTGGGRTISNADFEFIYRSLFKAGTGEAFDRIVLLARQEMAKASERARIRLNYGSFGIHTELEKISDTMMDAAYSESLRERTGIDYDYLANTTTEQKFANVDPTDQFKEIGDLLNLEDNTLQTEYGIQKDELINIFNNIDNTEERAAALANLYQTKLIPTLLNTENIRNLGPEKQKETLIKLLTVQSGIYDGKFEVGIGLSTPVATKLVDAYFSTQTPTVTNELKDNFVEGVSPDATSEYTSVSEGVPKQVTTTTPPSAYLQINPNQLTQTFKPTRVRGGSRSSTGYLFNLNKNQKSQGKELIEKLTEEYNNLETITTQGFLGNNVTEKVYDNTVMYDEKDYIQLRLPEFIGKFNDVDGTEFTNSQLYSIFMSSIN